MLSVVDPAASHHAPRRGGPNWTAIGVISAIAAALVSLLASGAGDYRKVGDRVTTLETQRTEDLRRLDQQRTDDFRWRERLESKVDRILERQR